VKVEAGASIQNLLATKPHSVGQLLLHSPPNVVLVVNFSSNVGGPHLVSLLSPIVLRPDDRYYVAIVEC